MSKAKRKNDATPADGSADPAVESSAPALSKKERKAAERAAERGAKAAKAAEREARKLAKRAAKEATKEAAKKATKEATKEAAVTAVAASPDVSSDGEKHAKKEKRAKKTDRDAEDATPPSDASMPKFKHVRKKRLSSGKGATAQEIGASLVALFNAGKSDEAEQTWYHRRIESIEEDGTVFEGWKGVLEKGKWWKETFTVLSMRASGPYVCANGFTVVFTGRVRLPDGTEVDAHECGVYTVEKGRIVREQFMQWRG